MRIEFAENDGYLHEDGKPRIFTFKVDGRIYPCPSDVTIGEFYERVSKAKPQIIEPEAISQAVMVPKAATNGSHVIERNDTVKYTGLADDEGELVTGNEYTVLEVKKDTVAILDLNSPNRIRLTVNKKDLDLVKKGIRVTHKVQRFEKTKLCQCGETVALILDGDFYAGQCFKCSTSYSERKLEPTS